MLIRGRPGAGGLRRALIAVAVITLAIGCSWLIPGLAWRGLAAMERPAAQSQADSVARPPTRRVPPRRRRPPCPAPRSSSTGRPTARVPSRRGAGSPASSGWCSSSAIGVALSRNRRRHPLAGGRLGARAPGAVRDLRAADSGGPGALPLARRPRHRHPRLLVHRLPVRLRRAGQAELEPGHDLRVPAPARDHLRHRAVRHPVLPRHHAAHRPRLRRRDEPGDGRERRGEPQRGGLDLHGADRGAAHHPAVPAADDALRADDGDDRRGWPTSPARSWWPTSRSGSRRGTCSPR